MQHQTLIIAGMHRSGTSLITNWLSRCGLQIGENLAAGGNGNIDGHFEDVEFLKLHEEILNNNSLHISGLVDAKKIELSPYQLGKLQSIINIKQQLYEQWGWKDPRTCLFLDTYSKLLPQAKYLVIMRDFQAVISSLINREFAHVDKKYMGRNYLQRMAWKHWRRSRREEKFYAEHAETYLKVWINYNEEILKTLKKLPADDYLVINYQLLLEKDEQVIDFLKDKWKFDLNYFDFSQVYKNGLMSAARDIERFIQTKTLLVKAQYLQLRLSHYVRLG
jgi:hypothetical protein